MMSDVTDETSRKSIESSSRAMMFAGIVAALALGLAVSTGCDRGGDSEESPAANEQSAESPTGMEEGDEDEESAEDESEAEDDGEAESDEESADDGQTDAGAEEEADDEQDDADKPKEAKAKPPAVTGKLTGSVSEQGPIKKGSIELMVRESGEVVGRFTGDSDKSFRIPVTGKVTNNRLEASGEKGKGKVTLTGKLSSSGADLDASGEMFGNAFEFGATVSK